MVVVGIDEAGRGCWAGPLVASAVVLESHIPGLTDSKKLTQPGRELLYNKITSCAKVGVGIVSARQVDLLGLTKATSRAMSSALAQIDVHYNQIVIDGNYNYLAQTTIPSDIAIKTLVKADASIAQVSAASIVAKVLRDNYMINTAQKLFPNYGFVQHVGYGTKNHHEMLNKFGPCREHRRSFKPVRTVTEDWA